MEQLFGDHGEVFYKIATAIFFAAIIHTFFTGYFSKLARRWIILHEQKIKQGEAEENSIPFKAGLFTFLGELEAVFGVWVIVLSTVMIYFYDWNTFVLYFSEEVHYSEALFVVVIMFISSTRPILKFVEMTLWKVARVMGGSLRAWWFTILTIGPLMGSVITEPAAMTICSFLLGAKFYDLNPDKRLRYATLALLFINISLGGTLSNFAAVPVIVASSAWGWSSGFVFINFGLKSMAIIIVINFAYYLIFREQFNKLDELYSQVVKSKSIVGRFIRKKDIEKKVIDIERAELSKAGVYQAITDKFGSMNRAIKAKIMERVYAENIDPQLVESMIDETLGEIEKHEMENTLMGGTVQNDRDPDWDNREDWVPLWVMLAHLVFLAWTIFTAHTPVLFIGGLLFMLAFANITPQYQNRINMKPAIMVGFFLASIIIHGGLQKWWVAPLLGSLNEAALLAGTVLLTAINDNAAIINLVAQIDDPSERLKYIVMSAALAGGGLTVIANAPNPAGISLLKKYFAEGFSPLQLFLWAMGPTFMGALLFYLF